MQAEVAGYPALAKYMGSSPGNLIYRRFRALDAKILLYRQAELEHLETRLNEIEYRDANAVTGNKKLYSRDWRRLSLSDMDEDCDQLHLIDTIKRLLKEYNDLILQEAEISRLEGPNPVDLKNFRRWLRHPNFGNSPLHGPDGDVWGDLSKRPHVGDWDPKFEDLVALHARHDDDVFSRFVSNTCIPFLHRKLKGNQDEITIYNEAICRRYCGILSTVLSSMLPVLSIIALYEVNSMRVRLVLVAIFTGIFSLTLALVTGARKVDIFASTTAFAAVQVVFIGTTGGRAGGS